MDVEWSRGGRIVDGSEEPGHRPPVDLSGPPAARATRLFDEETNRDRLPSLVEGLRPWPDPGGRLSGFHDHMVALGCLLTKHYAALECHYSRSDIAITWR